MKHVTQKALVLALAAGTVQISQGAESITEMFKESKAMGNFRLRYEEVDTSSTVDLLTLRTRFGFTTGTYNGFSILVEAEDVRSVLGVDGPLAYEPEVTEIDQAFVQYKTEEVTAKVGRQVITLDNHRFIGHVGWRQDRQTFDAARITYKPTKELALDASYLFQRNRIFGEALDAKSSDFLLNAAYTTSIGKLTGYAYLLDDELRDEESDTYGARFTGTTGDDFKFLYTAEFATQSITDSGVDFDTDYLFLEGGITTSGVTAKIGYEVLGSDDGAASFTTPLATLHAFNGWNDIFLAGGFNPTALPGGLEDTYVSVAGSVAGFGLLAVYHTYEPEEGSGDYGTEFGFQATKALGGGVTAGLKYSSYSEDGFAVDTDRIWTWFGYSF